jgi:hypothetical protein
MNVKLYLPCQVKKTEAVYEKRALRKNGAEERE